MESKEVQPATCAAPINFDGSLLPDAPGMPRRPRLWAAGGTRKQVLKAPKRRHRHDTWGLAMASATFGPSSTTVAVINAADALSDINEVKALDADGECSDAASACSLNLIQVEGETDKRNAERWDSEPTAWGDISHFGRFTGGTCTFFGCDQTRGPTVCHHFKCICAEGYLAFAGSCQPEAEGPTTALGTRTGETCRFGYCTVPHSTCKTGNCFCGKGFVAKSGICEGASDDLAPFT